MIDEHRHEIVPLPLPSPSTVTADCPEVKQSCVIILMSVFFASLLSRLSNKSQTSYHRSVGIHISLVFMVLLKGKHTHRHTHSLAGGTLNYSSLITITWNTHTDELCTLAQINEARSRPKQQQQLRQQQQQIQQLQHQQQLQQQQRRRSTAFIMSSLPPLTTKQANSSSSNTLCRTPLLSPPAPSVPFPRLRISISKHINKFKRRRHLHKMFTS